MTTGINVRVSPKFFRIINVVQVDLTKKTGKPVSFKDACDVWLKKNNVPDVELKDIL